MLLADTVDVVVGFFLLITGALTFLTSEALVGFLAGSRLTVLPGPLADALAEALAAEVLLAWAADLTDLTVLALCTGFLLTVFGGEAVLRDGATAEVVDGLGFVAGGGTETDLVALWGETDLFSDGAAFDAAFEAALVTGLEAGFGAALDGFSGLLVFFGGDFDLDLVVLALVILAVA